MPEPLSSPTPSRARGEPASDTKERLLDAAEQLFAERGFEGASIRAVTQAAGVGVSAANYHFGSKEELLRATLRRQVEPINRRRLERLDELEVDGSPPGVHAIMDAFLRPAMEEVNRRAARLVAARLYSDPPEIVSALKRDLFGELSDRFVRALGRALPDRPPSELALGLQFAIGVMVHVISGQLPLSPLNSNPPTGNAELTNRAVAFAAQGLIACSAREPAP